MSPPKFVLQAAKGSQGVNAGQFYMKVICSLAGSLDNEVGGPMERRKNHFNVWKDTWIDRYLDLPRKGRAVMVGLVAAVLGVAMDEAARAT